MSITNVTGAVGAITGWFFFWWLSGTPFPTERGADAVFFVLIVLCLGVIGFGVSKAIELERED